VHALQVMLRRQEKLLMIALHRLQVRRARQEELLIMQVILGGGQWLVDGIRWQSSALLRQMMNLVDHDRCLMQARRFLVEDQPFVVITMMTLRRGAVR